MTVLSGYCSVRFNYWISKLINAQKELYEPHIVERANNFQQTFDARIALMVDDSMVFDIYKNLYWRSVLDCHRNFVSGMAHALLGHKACHGKNTTEMVRLMKEQAKYDYKKSDFSLRYGIFGKRELFQKEGLDSKTGEKITCIRTRISNRTIDLKSSGSSLTKQFLEKYWDEQVHLE